MPKFFTGSERPDQLKILKTNIFIYEFGKITSTFCILGAVDNSTFYCRANFRAGATGAIAPFDFQK